MNPPRPRVSVISVTYNHRFTIGASLSLLAPAAPGIETIVVDNASTDGTAAFIKAEYPGVILVESTRNGGFGYGCNLGASQSHGETLLFLNPDARAMPQAVEKLHDFLRRNPAAGAVGPSILRGSEVEYSCRPFPGYRQALFHRYSLLTRLFPRNRFSAEYLLSSWDHASARRVDWLSGSALAVRRDVFESLGGFDEGYFLFCEDTDLCRRIWNAGRHVWYTPEAVVEHDIGESLGASSLRTLYQRHRSIWRYYSKFHGGSRLKNGVTFAGIGIRFGVYLFTFALRRMIRSVEK